MIISYYIQKKRKGQPLPLGFFSSILLDGKCQDTPTSRSESHDNTEKQKLFLDYGFLDQNLGLRVSSTQYVTLTLPPVTINL